MSLFKDTTPNPGNVYFQIVKKWGIWIWVVTYSANNLFDAAGFTLSKDKAISRAKKAVGRILRFEEKEALLKGEN